MIVVLGKVEGEGLDWHGHVTALSVSPEARNCGLAGRLLDRLECVCRDFYRCYYMDLFARISNVPAVSFYSKRGYRVYRTEKGYYSGIEDAVDMRRPFLCHDPDLLCLVGAEGTAAVPPAAPPPPPSLNQRAPIHGQQQQQQQEMQQQHQQGKGKKKRGKR